jgi:ubiquinone biosynthesis protein UbiJ
VRPSDSFDDGLPPSGDGPAGRLEVPAPVLAALEAALNRYLDLDPEGAQGFAPLYGRIIVIELEGLGMGVTLIPGPDRIQIFGSYDAPADCVIRGAPLSLARMALAERKESEMSSGSVQIEGDTTLAQQFAKALGGLDVDWEEQAARVLGDPIAHQVGQGMKGLSDWGRQTSRTLTADLKEYLEEEGRLVPTRYELDAFLAEVDTLRDDVERLEARLARLNQAAAAPTGDTRPPPKPAPKKATARKKAPAKKTSKPGDRPG